MPGRSKERAGSLGKGAIGTEHGAEVGERVLDPVESTGKSVELGWWGIDVELVGIRFLSLEGFYPIDRDVLPSRLGYGTPPEAVHVVAGRVDPEV